MSKEKKFINLPSKPFYRYDESFKKKLLNNISQGLLTERKATGLYSFNRNCIAKWKKAYFSESSGAPESTRKIKSSSETIIISEALLLHKELTLLRQELVSEKLCSEALLTIIGEVELNLQIPIQKKPCPGS